MSKRVLHITRLLSTPFDYGAISDHAVAEQAQAAAARIRGVQKAAIVDIGIELLAMRAKLEHGQFIPWVEQALGMNRRTATNMMTVADQFGDPAKWEMVSHLPTKLLYDLASPSTPTEVREAALKPEPGSRVDPHSLRHTLDRVKELDDRAQFRAQARELKRQKEEADPKYLRKLAREEKERTERQAERQIEAGRLAEAISIVVAALGPDLPRVQELLAGTSAWALRDAFLLAAPSNARAESCLTSDWALH